MTCQRVSPRCACRWERHNVKSLMSTGGWITISTIIMPLMRTSTGSDGSILTVSAVTYYATCSEIVSKLLVFPSRLGIGSFSYVRHAFGQRQGQTSDLFARSLSWLLGLLFPLILLL